MPGFLDFFGGGQPQMQPQGSFQQALSPADQGAPREGPPTTPQEFEQRKSGWQDFMHKIQNDPAIRTSIMMGAAQLMRGPDMGETTGDTLGKAIQMGTLAHSFLGANQSQQQMEMQKLEQQRQLNESNIAQNNAQTSGLLQNQGFELADRPLAVEKQKLDNSGKSLDNRSKQFGVDNQKALLDDQLKTSRSKRQLDDAHGKYYREGRAGTGSAAAVALTREDRLLAEANPQMEGETPQAYKQRLARMALDRGVKNQDAVAVQAAQAILRDGEVGSPEYNEALEVMRNVSHKALSGKQPAAGPELEKGTEKPKMTMKQARDAVKPGELYVGPDGKTYRRGN